MEIHETLITTAELHDTPTWPVSWSAVVTGSLASIAMITILGLYGTAIGIGSISNIQDFSTLHEVTLLDLCSAIFGMFFAYVVGGWVAGKITGERLAEPAILHGAISWLVTIPMLLIFLAIGLGKTFGGWYGGITSAIGVQASAAALSPLAIRHTATAAATSLLLGLIGSVIGGWLACGEPMSLTHHKTRSVTQRTR